MTKVTITLFTSPSCPHTGVARAFLAGQGVSYVERDVTADYLALRDLLYLVGRADVPTLCMGYEAAVGFDPGMWLQVLAHGRELEASGDPFILPDLFGDDPITL